jgi:GxxExxY protein
VAFRVEHKGHEIGEDRMDLLVERCLIVELKAVDRFTEAHVAQALSYLKATGHPLPLLINFNVPVLLPGGEAHRPEPPVDPGRGNRTGARFSGRTE